MNTAHLYALMRAFGQALEKFIQGSEYTPEETIKSCASEKADAHEKLFTREDAAKLSEEGHGTVVIPAGKEEICDRAFDGDKTLKAITIPGSIKKIGVRAFAECTNLEKVELAEGIETIESNVFTGCTALTELTVPDSVRNLCGWAFHRFTGLQKPIYNRSGTILYGYPCEARDKAFTIPDHVEQVSPMAFNGNPWLGEVVFPSEMKVFAWRTFLECGIRRITVPKSVTRIEGEAFCGCKSLEKVIVLGEDTLIGSGAFYGCPDTVEIVTARQPRYDERLHWFGTFFLYDACKTFPNGHHCSDKEFRRRAKGCLEGNISSMWELGNYFANLGGHEFYTYAANFWRYRAAWQGFAPAKEWLERWLADNPKQRMPSVSKEILGGSVDGRMMNYIGFSSFDVNRSYCVRSFDENGVVVMYSWCDDEGPDEDGFGREEFYDWWFLDKNLKPIPGTTMVHRHSHRDCSYSERYQSQYNKAVSVLKGE